MNIFNKSLLKQNLTKELKNLKNKSNFACVNSMLIKSFSSGVFTNNISVCEKTVSRNFRQNNFGFYYAKRNNFADKLPRHAKINMPNLSPSMTQGNIVEWKKKEGDKIKAGDVLAAVETDKAVVDFDYNDEGYLAKILFPSGAKDVKVGTLVAIIVDDQADVAAFKNFTGEESAQPAAQTPKSQSAPQQTQQAPSTTPQAQSPQAQQSERIFASPLARTTARQEGVSLEGIQGSGPRGRIVQSDVLEAKSKVQAQVSAPQKTAEHIIPAITPTVSGIAEYEDIEVSNIRRVTAERLAYSKANIPHFYIQIDCNVDKLSNIRNELNKHSPVKLSFNDLIIKAASLACVKVPETNSSWQGTFIRKYKNVDMSVAVQTDYGLMTPIIPQANLKGLATISSEMKDLAERAKQRKLKPQEFQGGTFTISNMGMLGITNFSAVINPPQACILAVGKSEKKVVYDENATDKNAPYKTAMIMSCTLSCDHRVVDGAFGAYWVQEFKKLIENPELMLL